MNRRLQQQQQQQQFVVVAGIRVGSVVYVLVYNKHTCALRGLTA